MHLFQKTVIQKLLTCCSIEAAEYQLRRKLSLSLSLSLCGSTALMDLGHFFSFLIYTQSVGLLGRGISPSQGRYLHTEQHKDIHALSGIRTHDPSVRAGKDGSCLRPRGNCDRLHRKLGRI
jgi:hypothetical protein